jgi:hypothetical protein
MGRYNTNALVVTGSSVGVRKSPLHNAALDISGSVFITGSLNMTGDLNVPNVVANNVLHPFLFITFL